MMTMKYKIPALRGFLILQICLLSIALQAQPPGEHMRDRVQAEMIGYLTSQLDLTADQAVTFFPIYKEWKEKERAVRAEHRPARGTDTRRDYSTILDGILAADKQLLALKNEYIHKLKSSVSDEQIVKLFWAERSFKERLIKNLRGRDPMRKRRPGSDY